ncbi:MAG: glycosyltransferase family 4 protein [Holophagales bacterium]|nr:MAG: glycosyltransferase family 4 protein [Holophagales bacterium]
MLNSASGGSAISTLDLVRAMRGRGVVAAAVCHDAGSPREREAVREAFDGRVEFRKLVWWNRKIRVRAWKRPALALLQLLETGAGVASARAVVQAAQQHRADLIHTNTILTPEGARASRRLRIPHVWHVRELVGKTRAFPLAGARGRVARLLRRAGVVAANSEATAAALRDATGVERITVVPNGVALEPLLALGPAPPGGLFVVAMVGSLLSRVKRHGLFLEAAAMLCRHPEIEFRIYGGGDRERESYARGLVDEATRRGLGERLRWMGHVEGAAAILADVAVLVHPAEQESFGRVLVEAMAAGRPVVAPRGGGAAEIVVDGETGFLVPCGDAAAMAAAVTRLLESPDLARRMGEAGRARAAERYALDRVVDSMLGCYRTALGEVGAR